MTATWPPELLAAQVPLWTAAIAAAGFWTLQRLARRAVRTWALITLPATLLHELAHAAVGLVTRARPASWSLWPRRIGPTTWRLGYVGFTNLRWWNGGAVALAPLGWALVLAASAHYVPELPARLPLGASIATGIALVWLWIAIAPGRTDWTLALSNWPSALVFLAAWGAALYALVLPLLV